MATVDGVRARAWPWAVVVALLFALGLAPAATGARRRGYQARVFIGPRGSHSVFNKVSDDGTAVGQRLLANGTSRSLVLTARGSGVSPLAGRQSALVGIDVADEMVGSVIAPGPMAPLFLRGRRAVTLSVAGNGNAIALGPLVAVTATGADGLQHALVWNPVIGSVRDLGPGVARGIAATGVVVGRTVDGQAAYWSADGVTHPLGFPGTLLGVNLFGRVVGFRNQSGGPTPIMLDLGSPGRVTNLRLPRGWRFGSAKGLADNGLIVGDAFKHATGGLPSEGLMWAQPNRPVTVTQLVRRNVARGVAVSDASGVNDNGLIVGSVTGARRGRAAAAQTEQEDAAIVYPDLETKGVRLRDLVQEAAPHVVDVGDLRIEVEDVREAVGFAEAVSFADESVKAKNLACRRLSQAGHLLQRARSQDPNFDLEQFKKDGIASVDEIRREIGC